MLTISQFLSSFCLLIITLIKYSLHSLIIRYWIKVWWYLKAKWFFILFSFYFKPWFVLNHINFLECFLFFDLSYSFQLFNLFQFLLLFSLFSLCSLLFPFRFLYSERILDISGMCYNVCPLFLLESKIIVLFKFFNLLISNLILKINLHITDFVLTAIDVIITLPSLL